MRHSTAKLCARLLCTTAMTVAVLGAASAANAADPINIAPQPLSSALREFATQSQQAILVAPELAEAKLTGGVRNVANHELALAQLLQGTGLTFRKSGEALLIVPTAEGGSPQDASASGEGAEVEALIVTAQKREENIQDVPIAISAFSQRDLEEQKIEGGFDLLKAIPNVTFSKSNFTSYNFSIRGVGTKAISATTDPGVAVALNNNTLIQNRLFEQEYFDIERVEVLRGPQGTLYGRNATSGVINVITAKPDLNDMKGSVKAEVGNYDTRRLVGMANFPIVEDKLAIRLAGAWTQRSGYDYNAVTENAINGRDLWSARVTVGFEPTDRFRGNLVWEHFEEDDDRSRTGKQLCKRDPGPTHIGDTPVTDFLPQDIDHGLVVPPGYSDLIRPALFSQGCLPVSLYDEQAFQTPNGVSLPFVFGAHAVSGNYPFGVDPVTNRGVSILRLVDPYEGLEQPRDIRTIASFRDPVYRAKADLLELSFSYDLTDALTFTSQTVYNEDEVYSFQDYNRFNSNPVFTDSTDLIFIGADQSSVSPRPEGSPVGTPGVFCDPQLGCSDTIAGFDISQATGQQFSQEFRLQSDFDGPVNFSLGANYTRFSTLIDYYVFYNIITALSIVPPLGTLLADPDVCTRESYFGIVVPPEGFAMNDPRAGCIYIDPNPIESINGEGHNYFRSKNPYKLRSVGAFGELYWNIREDLKLTAGLRYTDDIKTFTPVPSQVLLANGLFHGGTVNKGYPAKPDIEQQWGEFTGRLGLDWKPVLSFTDETLLYGSYSRGYKGGGANPPSPGFATGDELATLIRAAGVEVSGFPEGILSLTAVEYGRTFDPEFVNAFEIGAKNTLLGGAMTFNAGAFYYDYLDYQVSQIRDRTAVNENFDATIWGLEFETLFAPTRDLKFNMNLGYLDTEIAEGESSIDIMNRTQGDPNYVLVKPWVQLPSNCVVPLHVAEGQIATEPFNAKYWGFCGGTEGHIIQQLFGGVPVDTELGGLYDPANYPELNGGAGIKAQLGGNELPNSPHWTTNIGAQYSFDMPGGWRTTVRGDGYWQSQSFARVYNAVNDKLHGWYNANLSIWAEHEDWGLKVELYAKNILDDTPITDAFLNSDNSALTTNIFVLDPRIVGLSIRKDF